MKYVRTLRIRFALWTAGFLLAALILFGLFVYFTMSYSLATPVDQTLHLTAMQLLAEIDTRDEQRAILGNDSRTASRQRRLLLKVDELP